MRVYFPMFFKFLAIDRQNRRAVAIKIAATIFILAEIYQIQKINALTSQPYNSSVFGSMVEDFLRTYSDAGILSFLIVVLLILMPLIVSIVGGLRVNICLILACVVIIFLAQIDINNIYSGQFVIKASLSLAFAILFHFGCIFILPAERLVRFLSRNPEKWS